MNFAKTSVVGVLTVLTLFAAIVGPYVTHIVWCIQNAADTWQPIALLIVGVVIAPVGWLHGVSVIFGFTWI
ncbi:hypothetical protein [Thalassospira povalilytica]|uniref:hypothetical protein n=1 Tax=Thalassospira povalilytica TaxID=732237 RepID=UPI001D1852A8|nr:hypothetical protein [Thalassospira povalilytica]MCC4240352.1 hypothetical protein [Thalassospira povalilytica]